MSDYPVYEEGAQAPVQAADKIAELSDALARAGVLVLQRGTREYRASLLLAFGMGVEDLRAVDLYLRSVCGDEQVRQRWLGGLVKDPQKLRDAVEDMRKYGSQPQDLLQEHPHNMPAPLANCGCGYCRSLRAKGKPNWSTKP